MFVLSLFKKFYLRLSLPPYWYLKYFGFPGAGPAGTPAGSVHSGVDINSPVSNFTFEDKRKENFNKGQAELERRRQSLIDQQKREEEEKKKKEKEEAEAKEKQK